MDTGGAPAGAALVARVGAARVLPVMAAGAEYGPALRARIRPLMTGVGPVEAAVAVTRALAALDRARALPDLVVSLGSAGSARLAPTEVYQATAVSWRDIDASALGFPRGETPFLGLPAVLPMPLRVPGLPGATLSTGADVVSGAGYGAIDADMVDMETYAVLRACQAFAVPLVALRGISDGDRALAGLGDWTARLGAVDRNLAQAWGRLCAALETGGLDSLA